MDIAKVGEKSLRIKSKNASFIINPEKKIEEEIVILTEKPQDYSQFGDNIVISGPGEYEAAGVSIKGDSSDGGIAYDFLEDGQRLVVLSNPKVAKSKDVEDASAVAVFLGDTPDNLSDLTAELVVVIGPETSLPADRENIKKTDKINLKKTEEYKGFLVHLSK